MFIPLPVLAGAAIVVLVLVLLAFRRRSSRDLVEPPKPNYAGYRPAASSALPPVDATELPPHVAAEIRLLLSRGNKIEAIKVVRAATHLGLAEAKELVERM